MYVRYTKSQAVALILGAASSACLGAAESQRPQHHEADSIPLASSAARSTSAADPAPVILKNSGISIKWGGWVQADFIQDFDPVGNESQFKVNSIPVSGDPSADLGGNTNFQIKQTRLKLDTRKDTEGGRIRAYVEGDFFGSGNSFRIRHAYGEWNGLMAGQNWSTFQDISARPHTIDYEGPDAEVFVRQVQLRLTRKVSETLEWAIALEEPDSQISSAVGGSDRSEVPDLPAHLRFTYPKGHVQVGGLLRQLRYVSDDGAIDETTMGWGVNLSGSLTVMGSDAIMGSIATGSGMGRYVESFGGQNSDAVLTNDNNLKAVDTLALVGGYEHAWNSKYKSTLVMAYAEADNLPAQDGNAIKSATSMHANLLYTPQPQLLIGGELMWGERENFDGATGDALRFQLSIRYTLR